MRKVTETQIFRMMDANMNRAKEGLRVCEDVCRFLRNDRSLTAHFKKVRHALSECLAVIPSSRLISARDTVRDVGRTSTPSEFRRGDVQDIFYANIQRVKESVRVLEECMKLFNRPAAEKIKRLRYTVYRIEQKIPAQPGRRS